MGDTGEPCVYRHAHPSTIDPRALQQHTAGAVRKVAVRGIQQFPNSSTAHHPALPSMHMARHPYPACMWHTIVPSVHLMHPTLAPALHYASQQD
ncbi:hypothetical protein AAFF_G00225600 [Aldrovandia affinis]|uniref:Uncharacterized protein n=1 Tax=Aldrovandia affinis TaxID=143900 RepID=A0AAD7X262_9TELE|nr:hypothetical protein AAFF_G00225600 [Aldrovandia affinis]